MEFYQRHEVLVSMATFAIGFLFDILTLRRIDNVYFIIQQGIYLFVLGVFLILEIRHKTGQRDLWKYHNLVVHFLFGALLSIYTIFYYTSASALTSFIYILLLAGLMLANEIGKVRSVGLPVRVTLYTICTLSYFSMIYPVMLGKIGEQPFWLAFMSSLLMFFMIWLFNLRGIRNVKKEVLYPALLVHLFFLIGYYTALIPPVPVAVKKIGAYYQVEKRNKKYIGKYLPHPWKFWSKGSQEFMARPGDKVTILLSVFSPTRFQDQVTLRWYWYDENEGWKLEDSIPLNILGGRSGGFRGFGTKQYYKEGEWKVIVETSDGREVGSLRVEIKNESRLNERIFSEHVF
jgi:Protein of unknown function (DUF2914)